MSRTSQVAVIAVVVAIAAAVVYSLTGAGTGGGRQVWDPGHGHYHTVP